MGRKTSLSEAINTAKIAIKLAEKGNSKKTRAPFKMVVHLAGTDRAAINAVMDMGRSNLDCIDFSELLKHSGRTKKELIESIFYNYYDLSQNKEREMLIKTIMEETELPTLLKRGIEILSIEQ
jgi:hypothetical protein